MDIEQLMKQGIEYKGYWIDADDRDARKPEWDDRFNEMKPGFPKHWRIGLSPLESNGCWRKILISKRSCRTIKIAVEKAISLIPVESIVLRDGVFGGMYEFDGKLVQIW